MHISQSSFQNYGDSTSLKLRGFFDREIKVLSKLLFHGQSPYELRFSPQKFQTTKDFRFRTSYLEEKKRWITNQKSTIVFYDPPSQFKVLSILEAGKRATLLFFESLFESSSPRRDSPRQFTFVPEVTTWLSSAYKERS